MKETNKKRIDKESKLFVTNRIKDYRKLLLSSRWEAIEYNLFLNILKYYNSSQNAKM